MREKRTSITDLANSLGVSKATVSFVLNGKGDEYHISKGMQEKIHKKAKEMSYVPNFFAKSLAHAKFSYNKSTPRGLQKNIAHIWLNFYPS